jgi:hypothetical protein
MAAVIATHMMPLLRKCMKLDVPKWFHYPVDPVALKIPVLHYAHTITLIHHLQKGC